MVFALLRLAAVIWIFGFIVLALVATLELPVFDRGRARAHAARCKPACACR